MADLSITTTVNIRAYHTRSLDLNTVKDTLSTTFSKQLTTGTSASEANKLWHDKRNLAASGTDTLDLSGGLTDAHGDTAFTYIKGLVIHNSSATQTLAVGGAASDCWVGPFVNSSDKINVPPGGPLVLVNDGQGYAVTASSTDKLLIANGASNAASYQIIIWGLT